MVKHAKIHLKYVQEDGVQLLQGLRPFIIRLIDNKLHRGKICKSYDTIAFSEILSIKMIGDNIKNLPWFMVYEEILSEEFKRCHNFEIMHVIKAEDLNFAWIVATSPEQVLNIRKHKVIFANE